MSTHILSAKDIKREVKTIDAKNKVLGRLASDVATILMGKNKPSYVPYLDTGDKVIVTNAALVKVTGKKESQKTYTRHSGFPGGLRVQTLAQVRASKPTELVRHAVKGMLPKNRLGQDMITKLEIHAFEKGGKA